MTCAILRRLWRLRRAPALGADGADGAFLFGGCPAVPARHGRPRRRHRGRRDELVQAALAVRRTGPPLTVARGWHEPVGLAGRGSVDDWPRWP